MARRRAIFVDRDGTICLDKHYLADPDGLELMPKAPGGIKRLNDAGIPVIVITNQSGIARGLFDVNRLNEIHERLRQLLALRGARIDDLYFCPHMPNAGCRCRKPAPGMLLDAAVKHDINLKESFVIGDRMMDIECAHNVGARAVLVPEPGDQYDVASERQLSKEKPDFEARDFEEAVDWILRRIQDRRLPGSSGSSQELPTFSAIL